MPEPSPYQPQFDLPMPTPPASKDNSGECRRRERGREIFAGLTRWQMLAGLAAILALTWAAWVTRTLLAPEREQIVSARLSAIVGEYVQAQARSPAPPERVQAEMRRFMGALEQELQRRAARGQIVMVGEAVLSSNVPDITGSLKKAVYSSGIAFPEQASAQQMERLARDRAQPAAATAPVDGQDGASVAHDPMAMARESVSGGGQAERTAMPPEPAFAAGASVATFGGAGGAGER